MMAGDFGIYLIEVGLKRAGHHVEVIHVVHRFQIRNSSPRRVAELRSRIKERPAFGPLGERNLSIGVPINCSTERSLPGMAVP
jgi:hypothetical protein